MVRHGSETEVVEWVHSLLATGLVMERIGIVLLGTVTAGELWILRLGCMNVFCEWKNQKQALKAS
jgi:hypothetical protein